MYITHKRAKSRLFRVAEQSVVAAPVNRNGAATTSFDKCSAFGRAIRCRPNEGPASGQNSRTEGCPIAEGLVTLSSQSSALGLSRSTTWAILQANHKGSGLSGAIIKRMLLEAAPARRCASEALGIRSRESCRPLWPQQEAAPHLCGSIHPRRGIAAECEFEPGPVAHRT